MSKLAELCELMAGQRKTVKADPKKDSYALTALWEFIATRKAKS